MRKSKLSLAPLAAALAIASAPSKADTVYIDLVSGDASLTGSITTDDTLGPLSVPAGGLGSGGFNSYLGANLQLTVNGVTTQTI
jgi:hypothetical protein